MQGEALQLLNQALWLVLVLSAPPVLAAALVGSIEQVPVSELSADKTASWSADYARLCAKAPPPLKTLSLICEGEQSAADGHPDHVPQPGWFRRTFADFKS